MKNQTRILFALLSVIAGHAHAASLEENLAQHLQGRTKVLSRDVYVYHWAPRQQVGDPRDQRPLTPTDRRGMEYLNYLKERFWDPNTPSGGAFGSGLYVAIDPSATVGYAGLPDFTLFQIVMPKGAKILDTLYEDPFSVELYQQMQQAGCQVGNLHSLFTTDKVSGCRAVRDRMIRALDLQAVTYGFQSTLYSNCVSNRPSVALVLFDDRVINYNRAVIFTKELPNGQDAYSENRLMVHDMLRSTGYQRFVWAELEPQRPRTEMKAWMQKSLWGCGSFAEDFPPK